LLRAVFYASVKDASMPTAITGARTVINDDATISGTGLTISGYHVNGKVTITNLDQCDLIGIYARDGFIIEADVGAGVYNNSFISLHTGLNGEGPAKGFQIRTADPEDQNRCNGNIFVGCSARFCATVGFELLRASTNTLIGCGSEGNGKGITAETCVRTSVIGGHFETNTDADIELLAGTSHFRIIGAALLSTTKVTGANKDATGNVYEEDSVFRTVGTLKPTGTEMNWVDLLKADTTKIRLNSE
jgi:hypothetical protein